MPVQSALGAGACVTSGGSIKFRKSLSFHFDKETPTHHNSRPINDIREVNFFSCVVAQIVNWLLWGTADCRDLLVKAEFSISYYHMR
jgi:hypothetical protein